MSNRYIRGDKETRMARLSIIEQGKIVEFIDNALEEKLTRLEEKASAVAKELLEKGIDEERGVTRE